jgi:hypothetical protein
MGHDGASRTLLRPIDGVVTTAALPQNQFAESVNEVDALCCGGFSEWWPYIDDWGRLREPGGGHSSWSLAFCCCFLTRAKNLGVGNRQHWVFEMGRRTLLVSGTKSLDQKSNSQNSPKTKQPWANRPHGGKGRDFMKSLTNDTTNGNTLMGVDIRMDPKWWNGKNEDDRCHTYLIDCELHFMGFLLVNYYKWRHDEWWLIY